MPLRNVAMVGAGVSSLLLGCDLLRHGYDVTIYSDRTAEQIGADPIAAGRLTYHRTLEYERELGLNFWGDEESWFDSLHVDFCLGPANRIVAIGGRLEQPGQSVDLRRKYGRWLPEFERRGGKLEIASVDLPLLDQIAERHDVVFVTAGKASLLTTLFELDEERSLYSEPPRKHTLLCVRKIKQSQGTLILTLTNEDGDVFRVPYLSDAGEPCYNILFEARAGKGMDRFDDINDPDELVRVAKETFIEFAPWEEERLRDFELVDPRAWGRFAVLPVVRKPVGRLPSGRVVMGMGDVLVVNDPVAGQGANLASRMARFMGERIVEHGDRAFTEEWMQNQFDEFWEDDARYAYSLSSMFLEIPKPYQELMLAASRLPAVAHEFFGALNEPHRLWPWIEDVGAVRRHVTEMSGKPWWKTTIRARAGVVTGQIARRLPFHSSTAGAAQRADA